ncbi:MAG: tetratricopeptide repeat protein [Proteobacteria bacterium]|nr:tetratricopeptide repeat protein [Pseudomonadota bacterium]MCZ6893397.1 tetratricopeptide repeat protein [Gammaproteobacteria bacterium]
MAESKRRLRAILSADVAGYSRLMGDNEKATVKTLNAYRDVFSNSVADHAGRVVDTAGDSVLAVFESVVEAVDGALEIQTELEERNAMLLRERRMRFRIGINLGDVIEQDDGTIYGDGVNIAARLESLADPGGIALSGTAHDFVDGKIKATINFVGEHEVKNIAKPVRVYRIGPRSEAEPESESKSAAPRTAASKTHARPSIAVLPFTNMSDDAEESYFADGISEDIITELSRFKELIVTARNSSFTYKDKAVNAQQIGIELGVRYILEGSVRKAGDRVRVTAQLIEAEGGHHIWAERFDRRLEDVFAVQDELTSKIVATLVGQLVDTERRRVGTDTHTEDPKAYDLVLRGRELFYHMNSDDNLAARKLYEQAIELDPSYGRAYASLAWTYMMAYNEYWSDEQYLELDRALEIAQRGVQVDPASHSNRLALGQVHFFRKALAKAIESFEKAIDLNPNDPDGYAFLSQALSLNGQSEKAIELLDHAFELNANLGQWHRMQYIVAYFNARRYNDAALIYERLENPHAMPFYQRWIAATFTYLGRDEEARAAAARYRTTYPNFDLTEHLCRIPFAQEEDREHYGEGLRRAGLA